MATIEAVETVNNVDSWIIRWRRSDEPGVRYHFHLDVDRKTPLTNYISRFHFGDSGQCISQTYPSRSSRADDLAEVARLISFGKAEGRQP